MFVVTVNIQRSRFMKVELTGIDVRLGHQTTKLSLKEAKELMNQLNKLFGESVQWLPPSPIIIERDSWDYWKYPTYTYTTCKTDDSPVQVYCSTNSDTKE